MTVVDSAGAFVPHASVTFTPMKDADAAYYTSPSLDTDESGIVRFTGVLGDRPLVVCAKHPSHTATCSDPLTPDGHRERKTVLRMDCATLRGRVTGHTGTGAMTLVDNLGRITEEATLRGTALRFASRTVPSNTPSDVSDRRPLYVLTLPLDLSGD